MKTRKNIEVEVSVIVREGGYPPNILASSRKSRGGEMTVEEIQSMVEGLSTVTKCDAVSTINSVADKDKAEKLAGEKK